MRRFLIKIMVFLVPLILYFALNATLNYYLISNQKIDLGEPQVLIIGDSHPQRSINPKLFKRAQNIAQTAEPYISTYWKLKTIIKAHKPDTILLGFAPHNISEFNDMKFSDEFWAGEMFRRIYPIAKFSEIKNKIPVNKKLYFQTLWKQTAF